MATKPRRRLNLKLLVILLAASAVSTVGVYFVHGAQVHRTATYLLVQAEKEEAAGNLDKAVGALELYLGFRPDDTDGLVRYGRVRDKRAKDYRAKLRAAETLERAGMRDPALVNDLRRAAEIYSSIGQHKLAKAHWESFLRTNPNDGIAEVRLAVGEDAASNYDKAEKLFEAGIKHAPREIDGYTSYIRFLQLRRKALDRATAVADAMVASNPESDRAYTERARFRLQNRLNGADEDIARALKLNPDSVEAAMLAAQLSIIGGKPSEAVTRLSKTVADHPDDPRALTSLAQAKFADSKVEEGLNLLRKAVKDHPDDIELALTFLESLIARNKPDEAETIIGTLRPRLPGYAPLAYAEAKLSLVRRKWAEAARKLEMVSPELVKRGQNDQGAAALYIAGTAYERLEAYDRALASYNGAAGILPNWVGARFRAAASLASLGRIEEAVSAYKRLPADTPGVRSAIIRAWLAENERNPLSEERWKDVDTLIAAMRASPTEADESVQIGAEILLARKKFAEARALVQAFRDAHPDRPAVPLVLAKLLQAEGKADEALSTIDRAQEKFGDLAAIRVARAGYWAVRGGGQQAQTALAAIREGIDAFTPDEQTAILSALAMASVRIGNRGEGENLFNAVVAQAPENLQFRRRQLALEFQSGTDKTIGEHIEAIHKIEGEGGIHWRVAEANLLLRQVKTNTSKAPQTDLKTSRTRATEVLAIRKDLPEAVLVLAEIDEIENQRDAAIANYQKVIEAGVRSPMVFERLGRLLAARGRFRESNEAFRMLDTLGATASTPELKKLIAEVAVVAGDEPRGANIVRALVPADSKVAPDLLWQARMLAQSNQMNEAEAATRRALAIDATVPGGRLTLVQILMAAGAKAKAEAEAEQAEKLLPPDSEIDRAQLAAALGRLDIARRHFEAAVAAKPDDPRGLQLAAQFVLTTDRPGDALPYLRKLVALEKSLPGGVEGVEAAKNRRNLATVLSTSRQPKYLIDAERLVDQNLATHPDSIDDQALKARLVAAQVGRAKEAIALFEGLRRRRPLPNQDVFTLATLYEATDDWPSARQTVLPLLNATPPSGTVLAWYASRLLKRKEVPEAGPWISRLETVAPKAIDTAILRARYLAGSGQGEAAAALLESKAAENDAVSPSVALILEEVGQYDAARRVLDAMVKSGRRVDAPLVLAEFLARRGKVSEALDLCDAAWKTSDPQQVALAMNSIFDSPAGHADTAARARALKSLDAAIVQYPKIKALYVTTALLLLSEGRVAESEATYRRAMAMYPNDTALTNNLAWVLCFVDGRGAEALSMIEGAIKEFGPESHFLDTRGLAQVATDHADLAIADFEKSISVSPNDVAIVCFHLARAQVAQRNLKAARESMRKAEGFGFTIDSLHAIEVPSYRTLLKELAAK